MSFDRRVFDRIPLVTGCGLGWTGFSGLGQLIKAV